MTNSNRMIRLGLGAAVLAVAAASWSCGSAGAEAAPPRVGSQEVVPIPPLPAPPRAVAPPSEDSEPGLVFRLDAEPTRTSPPGYTVPAAARLSRPETDRLLSRLPAAPADPDTAAAPFPTASPPPPRTGTTLLAPFPPPDSLEPPGPVEGAETPLEVLRVLPLGETELAPHLSITFSQPMVPLAALGEIAGMAVPVRLAPDPPGRWVWLDTRTLRFEPDPRFPMATRYTVEVPAGVRSELGGTLAAAVREEFVTPAPTAIGGYPHADGFAGYRGRGREDAGDPAPLHPVILLVFDQRVDPAAMLPTIRLMADGRRRDVRLATGAEVAADSVVSALVEAVDSGRWVALRPSDPLPGGADVRVVVAPGTPSAEGPRVTDSPQELRFRTYGPLAVEEHGCAGDSVDDCRPAGGFWVRFNNALDEAAWSDELVRTDPEIPELRVEMNGRHVRVYGWATPRTTYRLILDPSIRDVFGQTLGGRRVFEFRTGDLAPRVSVAGEPLVVLDPTRPPRVAVHSTGHETLRVRVQAVGAEHWDAYQSEVERYRSTRSPESLSPPGRPVLDTIVSPVLATGSVAVTWVDLSRALDDGVGHAVIVIEGRDRGDEAPSPGERARSRRRGADAAMAWAQATRIGVSAAVDGDSLQAWTTSLVDGRPLAGVRVALLPSGQRATTDSRGLAAIALASTEDGLLVARQGDDTALLPENPWPGRASWRRRDAGSELRWLVFSDRGLYRPGEQAHLKGWIRAMDRRAGGDLSLDDEDRIRFTATGPRGEELGDGELGTGPLGGFSTVLDLPRELNTGHARLRFDAPEGRAQARPGRSHHLPIRIHEFRRPEYEVSVEADPGPHTVGGAITATVRARYYGGGGLAGAPVEWRATARDARYVPPGWDRWYFGRPVFWGWGRHAAADATTLTVEGVTDAHGDHHVRAALLDAKPPFTTSLRFEAQVQDVDRQAGSGGVDVLVHPAANYVGLRTDGAWGRVGDSVSVETIVVDVDGRPVSGRDVELRLAEREWGLRPVRGAGGREPAEASADTVVCRMTSGPDPGECVIVLRETGPHVLRAEVRDEEGRLSRSELPVWVAGPPTRPAVERPGGGPLELIPDREEYEPGDTARVMVQAPFHPAEGLWTLRRGGIVETGRFRTEAPSHELRIPVEESHIPGARLRVELVAAGAGSAPGSEFRTGEVALAVPPYARTLDVRLTPADTVASPGATTAVTVEVRDALGQPRPGAEVALWMVDEAILALGDYQVPDPMEAFYPQRHSGVRDHAMRQWVVRAPPDPADAADPDIGMMPAPPPEPELSGEVALEGLVVTAAMSGGRGGAEGASAGEPVDVRTDFSPLAVFEPSLRTGPDGRVTVPVTLPGTLTRYRVMAVAVDGAARFGRGEASVTARRELMVRLSAPRFLRHGDRVDLAATVQNLTTGALDTEVAVRGAGLRFDEGRGRRVLVPAGDRVEVRIPATAVRAGPVPLEAVAAAGARSDAAAITLPVYEPGTAEAFATYGELDNADLAALPLSVPADALPGFGGLEVTVSSTALHALTDALLFLERYPYEGPEPVASRLLAVAAVRDVLVAFEAEGLPPAHEIVASAERDVAELARMQQSDGGWSLWHADRPSHPFVSIHATHALQRARENDFNVPSAVMERAVEYLRTLQRDPPAELDPRDREALAAYALYVLARMGDAAAVEEARRRVGEAGPKGYTAEAGVAAAGWLLHALAGATPGSDAAAELRRQLTNRITETAAAATFATSYDDGSHVLLHSDRRSDAVALEALIRADPGSDLVPKLARGLLAHRTRGRWRTTQENAWVLLALGNYFQEYERVESDFATRVWVGDRFAGGHEFRGRSTDRWHLAVPLRELAALPGAERVLVQRDGRGRLYYRAGLRYAPADYDLPPLDRGFAVERSYEAVDDPADVRRHDDGTWRIRAGSRVRVRVSMIAPSVRHHVALMDPLPAGLEPLVPELRGTGFDDDPPPIPAPADRRARSRPPPPPRQPSNLTGRHRLYPYQWGSWRFRWFEHQNLRDDRAEVFASRLPAGVYEYTYLARATAHGTFLAAPPRAEEMYAPETFGRGAPDGVIIE